MKLTLMAAFAVTALAAATGASANVLTPGVYVAGDFGYHWPAKLEAQPTIGSGPLVDFKQQNDWLAFGRIGYAFNPNWRLELEGGYRPSDIDRVYTDPATNVPGGLCTIGVTRTAASPTCGALGGKLKVKTLMANAIYDIAPAGRVHPFIGAGAGVAWGEMNIAGQYSSVPAGQLPYQNVAITDTNRHFAYQGILGVSVDLSDNVALDLTGRYLRSTFTFHGRTTNGGTGGAGGITDIGALRADYKDV